MMKNFLPVGLFAGLASALLFASIGAGSALSLFLIHFSPLPIMIAAMGWGQAASLTAAGIAGLCLLASFGVEIGVLHLLSIGFPAWWLCHLALLARVEDDKLVDWYPVGRLLVWIAAITIALSCLAMLMTAGSISGYEAVLRDNLTRIFDVAADNVGGLGPETDREELLSLAILVLPPMVAAGSLVMTLFNLWAAARITRASGRLIRPWPDLAATTVPNLVLPVGTLAIAAALLPEPFGFIGRISAATFIMVLALIGLAVIHVGTRPVRSRPFILAALYILLIFQIGTLLLVAILGAAEQIFGIRARLAARTPPSTPQ